MALRVLIRHMSWAVGLGVALVLGGCGGGHSDNSIEASVPSGTVAQVALLETSDLHFNILSYDYFKLKADPTYGFERTAALISQARRQYPNTVLLDNGDTIQGTALADEEALVQPIACGKTLAMYKVMNAVKFDAATIGNHEFNYGLPFLNQVVGGGLAVEGADATKKCAGPEFPLVLSNILSNKTGQPLFKPYTIITKQFTATAPDGKTVTVPLRVGVIGFTPPGSMNWDKRWLDGKVTISGAVESAQKYIPQMRKEGADLVVALLHGGLEGSAYSASMENPGLYLSKVPGIDAMFLGHSHALFPDRGAKPFYTMTGVDNTAGTINGVPAAMPLFWGKGLGVVALQLTWNGSQWTVDKSKTQVEVRQTIKSTDSTGKVTAYVDPDPAIAPLVEAEHQATIQYVKSPIGTVDYRMTTYFADVGDPGAIQIVNQAQADYVAKYIQTNLPEFKNLPVLSVSAPFKSGFGGGSDYTDVAAGPVAIFNAADLYLYPNTVYAVKVTGAEIKTWLESAAQRFNRLDPAQIDDQNLISTFPGYNFDMFTTPDVQYEIDVTQPKGSRIKKLTYKGAPMDAAQNFIIATNNYRATSGKTMLASLDGRSTIFASPDTNRDVLIDYIKANPRLSRAANGNSHSWRFTPVKVAGRVLFTSAPGMVDVARAAGLNNIAQVKPDDGSGKSMALYSIDLSP